MRGRAFACLFATALAVTPACAARATDPRQPERPKHHVIPALEIVFMDGLLNIVGRRLYDDGSFDVTPATIRRNARGPWVVDNDPIQINQIGHPYQGAMYHAIARATGLGYWRSAAYAFGGSVMWEIAGETTRPSWNDQVASGIAGSFLGEALFRTANLIIDKTDNRPGIARSLLVLALSPPTSFNRVLFGDYFDTVFPTHAPAYDLRVHGGASMSADRTASPTSSPVTDREGIMDASVEYGLPGKPSYAYTRPFDYFSIRAAVSTANGVESVTTRGLLAGRSYDAGPGGRGVWGIYGVYDYISPQIFRVSSTAASLGTSLQFLDAGGLVLQATAMGGVGYAAIQAADTENEQNYHYGLAPQLVGSLRAIAGDRVSLDLSASQYFVSGIDGSNVVDPPGSDRIFRGEAALGVRLFRRSAITVRYLMNRREATFPIAGLRTETRSTIGVFYTLLGPQHFGAINWRRSVEADSSSPAIVRR